MTDDGWCVACGETFRYDDTGGYNPPCRCAEKCRSCCNGACDEASRCPAVSDDGDECILSAGHTGSHQRRRCDGTCDTCECDFVAAVTPLGEGGDEPWRCMAPRSHGLRCCVLNDRDDETCGACGSDRPRAVSLPPQRSDETRWVDVKCGACGTGNSRLPGADLWYCGACGEPLPAGARSGAGVEEVWQDRADVWRALGLEPSTGTADEAIAAIIALRAQIAEARKKNKALREALIAHRADLHNWSSRPCPTCRASAEVLGIDGKVPTCCARGETDATALAAAHPTEENRS